MNPGTFLPALHRLAEGGFVAGEWRASFGAGPLDPATYAGVGAVLTGVALVASALPAWRASRTDPTEVLRAE